ncbi:uncharacterized protein LOC129778650 [Toxorhynchites rutilus septentrionalis]|uniref:uncharacterized protein LOC129778650 n=1 Tax=Toxorhynchites rutilus septentrionalis TaxID=329112 RepID=UPI0024786FF7|nr:uncharacterized protein LOC129778650 [Toxorhynchites rutilus septentrionalis]
MIPPRTYKKRGERPHPQFIFKTGTEVTFYIREEEEERYLSVNRGMMIRLEPWEWISDEERDVARRGKDKTQHSAEGKKNDSASQLNGHKKRTTSHAEGQWCWVLWDDGAKTGSDSRVVQKVNQISKSVTKKTEEEAVEIVMKLDSIIGQSHSTLTKKITAISKLIIYGGRLIMIKEITLIQLKIVLK